MNGRIRVQAALLLTTACRFAGGWIVKQDAEKAGRIAIVDDMDVADQ